MTSGSMSKTKTSDQLMSILADMGDKEFDSHSVRSKNYTKIINSLHNPNLQIQIQIAEQILDICMMDLSCDLQYSSSAIIIISHILKKIKEKKCDCSSEKLLQSALTITKTAKVLLIKPLLRKLTFETLLSFPDEILIDLVSDYSRDVIDLIDSVQLPFEGEVAGWISQMIVKLLKILPPEKKNAFVGKALHVLFDFAIPSCMIFITREDPVIEHCIAALELLTDCVKHIDYSNNPKWIVILRNICDGNKYPAILKACLPGNHWNRIWNIFIILLKDQITKIISSNVSPINALLPVVEQAFKMDVKSRCLAFECWNVLIENFSTELSETLVNKRLKLLMIPLKLNNAKVEETVLAKLNTWWHLVRRFHSKMDKFTDTVLIPFLNFCFGKPEPVKTVGGKICVVPGQLTNVLSVKCIEVLVEIVGHIDCHGCCNLPSVDTRLISTKLLVEHWGLWLYCLQSAIKTAAANYSDEVRMQITCLWKGLVVVIGELPENQIRADLFLELLDSVDSLLDLCEEHNNMADIIFDVLIRSLFVDDPKIRPLLKSKNGTGPIYTIFRIIVRPSMNSYFARCGETLDDKIDKLKPIATFMINDSIMDSESFQQYVKSGTRHELWAALSDTFCDVKYDANRHAQLISDLVFWPVRTMSSRHQEYAEEIWYRWYNLYNYVSQLLNTNVLHREILSIVSGKNALQATNIHFKLCASVALLKQILLADKKFKAEAQILLDAISEANGKISVDKYMPILFDTSHLLLRNVSSADLAPAGSNVEVTKIAIMILQVTFKLVNVHLMERQDAEKPVYIDNLIESTRKFLSKICLNVAFRSLDSEISKLRTELEHTISKKSKFSKEDSKSYAIEHKSDEITKSSEQVTDSNKNDFTTPEPKSAIKTKSNKKGPNIVNTVVENGEEFVVVKTNWKFNPKKLTENQKEKLKRKREDIPALYQDLSQSQDEFKLKTWKSDSQDATTSKSESNSKSADDVAIVLQKLPNTEVVPKIIENIFNESINKITSKNNEKRIENVDNDNNNRLQKIPTPKGPKTPRLALKDRVFRNVRNLIEKSGLQSEITPINQLTKDLNQTVNENVLKTPISKSKTIQNLINSAPPKILSERPTRSIKKPKKFEDTEMFALKKKRRSQSVPPQDDTSSDKVEVSKEPITITKEVEKNVQLDQLNKDVINHQEEPQIEKLEKPTEVNVARIENSEITETILEKSFQPDKAKPETEKMEMDEPPAQTGVIQEQPVTTNTEDDSQVIKEISTPKPDEVNQKDEGHSTTKKKRSRIVKQLLIDMVEGHPILQLPQSKAEKRVTRKNINIINETNDKVSKRRKSLIEKSKKIKAELLSAGIVDDAPKDKPGSKSSSPKSTNTRSGPQTPASADQEAKELSQIVTVLDSQEQSSASQDFPMSEDVIESSQDSTLTAMSVKSATKKKVPIVCLDKENFLYKPTDTQKLIDDFNNSVIPLSDTLNDTCNQKEKEDIELPKNKTMPEEKFERDLTENLDTEPMESSGEVIIFNNEATTPIIINTEDTVVGKETQELAEADTLPVDVESQSIASLPVLVESESIAPTLQKDTNYAIREDNLEGKPCQSDNDVTIVSSQEDLITPTLSETAEAITDIIVESSNTGSPLKDEVQRKKEFLNDTVEISPIKTLSPVREKKSPSPETSSDYVVIKLTSPVQSNGEPFNDKCDSPEVFTEDKISPEKRDQSPPRKEVVASNSSPSSSLSLKKNKPQMRFNGRAAQMLGLCVPENMQILNTDRSDIEESRRNSPVSTPARRNLKRFYAGENNDKQSNENESEENENFLKFTRPLPKAESSPCNPILKRKLVEVADDTTISPASKRKRVSFHDPPVSTTVSVQKYIEPCGVRSPSNSANKRQERQGRSNIKSPKRLENFFRLETVLTKAVESFTDENTISNDTEISLDETPAAEVVKTSELNDTDPICPELLDCNDPIQNIAGDLASPYTKALLIKELASKVKTIADLAKMTELEVNRLCIKAPKVSIAKKVLSKYATRKAKSYQYPVIPIPYTPTEKTPVPILQVNVKEKKHVEVQTNEISTRSETQNAITQTTEVAKALVYTQTEIPTAHCSSQTNESGSKSTKDVVSMCLNERRDFVDQLSEQLPFDSCLSLLLNKMTAANSSEVLNQVITQTTNYTTKESKGMDLKVLQGHLVKRFVRKDLILFCSQLLHKIYDEPS